MASEPTVFVPGNSVEHAEEILRMYFAADHDLADLMNKQGLVSDNVEGAFDFVNFLAEIEHPDADTAQVFELPFTRPDDV